jgi:hypothetical protein
MVRRSAVPVILAMFISATVSAQDQTIIIDRPLQACSTPKPIRSADLEPGDAAEVIKTAFGIANPDPTTYYIVHSTEFVPSRPTVAEENWYVYYAGWVGQPAYRWFADSRQAKHFTENRIFGSSRIALAYLYVNVPVYSTRSSLDAIVEHFRRVHPELLKAPASASETAERQRLLERLRGSVPPEAETRAQAAAARRANPAPGDGELIIQLEAERYLYALARGDRSVVSEVAFIDQDNGNELIGLTPDLATAAPYASLSTLFYKIGVTKKTPAPVANFKSALKLAVTGQADTQTRLFVPLQHEALCAGGVMDVKHVPSDVRVTALSKNAKDEEVERSHETFDNEGRYWWDISFALPLDLRRDVTVDVDAGQVAAKSVEKADLFAVVNLGMPRDTKRIQWQLVPTFIYGIPITGKPLKHHLVGFTIGLNYVQLMAGLRLDRREQVATSDENGTPVGVESTPGGKTWEHKWVWGINVPVGTIVNLFTKNGKK